MCCFFDLLYPVVCLCVFMLFAGSFLPICSDQYVMSKKNRDAIAEAVRLGYCFRFPFVFNNGYVIVEKKERLQLLLLSSVYPYYYLLYRSKAHVEKLGTVKGVFLPCVQTIMGIIVFIRLPYITGQVIIIQLVVLGC